MDRPRHRAGHRRHPVAVHVGRPLVHAARLDPEDGPRHRARRPCSRLYAYFFWTTQRWTNFNPDYVDNVQLPRAQASRPASSRSRSRAARNTTKTCGRSAIADMTADLTDFNVNQNAWISSMILYKLGFFGMPWESHALLRQQGVVPARRQPAVRRTATELVDNLGRVRGTSQIDRNLQGARQPAVRRVHLVFRRQPVRPEDADAELSTARPSPTSAPSTTGWKPAMPSSTRAPTISIHVHRPRRQRHRHHLGDPEGPRRELQ